MQTLQGELCWGSVPGPQLWLGGLHSFCRMAPATHLRLYIYPHAQICEMMHKMRTFIHQNVMFVLNLLHFGLVLLLACAKWLAGAFCCMQ